MRRWPPALGLAACLVAAATLLGSCGVPTGGGAQSISRSAVPFGLLSPSTTTPPGGTVSGSVAVQIYFVNGGHLAGVARLVRPPATLQRAIDALLQGPSDNEISAGITTGISSQTVALSTATSAGLATLNLSSEFGQATGQQQVLAVAQLVFTATAVPGVAAVTIELDGNPIQVPVGNGSLTQPGTPLTRADFAPQA